MDHLTANSIVTERDQRFRDSNRARAKKESMLGETIELSGGMILLKIDGRGELHFFSENGSRIADFAPETFKILAEGLATVNLPVTLAPGYVIEQDEIGKVI